MALTSGTRLGPYEVESPIGAGGMGEVYRARDTRLGRDVAIKVLPNALTKDADRLRRFELEARTIAALNHPNILGIHDIGTHDGAPFLVSELLEGKTLRETLEAGSLPMRRSIEYALGIAQGLAGAHDKGIVHRDLKPENVFITMDGRVKILDFGLAKLASPKESGNTEVTLTSPATLPGVVMGTVGYMSPEQVRGDATDARADIFSFGAVLYEMLTGKRAFRRNTSAETMTAILREEPPELSDTGWHGPPGLQRILARCLEKNAERRFQSASDLAFAVESLSGSSSEISARSMIRADVPAKPRRAWLPWAVAVLCSLALVAAVWRIGRGSAVKLQPKFARLTYEQGFPSNARFAKDGQTVVYSAQWNNDPLRVYTVRAEFPQSTKVDLPSAALLTLSSTGDMEVAVDHVQESWFLYGTMAQTQMTGGTPRAQAKGVLAADYSPDGKTLAIVHRANRKVQLEYPEGKVIYATAGYLDYVRVSPSGKEVAFAEHPVYGDDRGWVSIGKVLYETPGWLTDVRISPDGRHIAFLEHPIVPDDIGYVAMVDLQGHYTKLTKQNASCHGLAWSPDGKEVWHTASIHGEEAGLYAVDLSGHVRAVLRSPIEVQIQDISPSGEVLLESVRYNLEIGVKQSAAPTRTIQTGGRTDLSTVSSDGQYMLLCHFEGSDYKIYITRTGVNSPVELGEGFGSGMTADNGWVAAMQVAKPHKLILYPTGAGQPREFDLGSLTAAFSGNENGVTFSRDGRLAMFTAYDTAHNFRDYLLDLTSGKVRPVSSSATQDGKLSPDGTRAVATDIATGKPMLLDVAPGKTSAVPGVEAHEEVLGWSTDGASLLVWDQELPAKIYSLNLSNGRRQLIQTIETNGAVGAMYGRVAVSGNGRVAAYRLRRGLYTIYTAVGLR